MGLAVHVWLDLVDQSARHRLMNVVQCLVKMVVHAQTKSTPSHVLACPVLVVVFAKRILTSVVRHRAKMGVPASIMLTDLAAGVVRDFPGLIAKRTSTSVRRCHVNTRAPASTASMDLHAHALLVIVVSSAK